MENQEIVNMAKETLIVLDYFDKNLIDKISEKFLNRLKKLAIASKKEVHIDTNKKLSEQDISEETKDLIALIYYSYIANEQEKQEIVEKWNENERIYQKQLEERYNPDNMFKNKIETENKEVTNLPIEIKKKSLQYKIKDFIKKIVNWLKNTKM